MLNCKNSCNFASVSHAKCTERQRARGVIYMITNRNIFMENQSDKKPRLTAKEEEAMRILWEHGPLLVKEVLEYLPNPKPHINTVSTVIRVLEKKGYVGHEKEGGTYRYHTLLEKDSYKKTTLMDMLKNYFDNNFKSLVSALVEEKQLTDEEIKECIDIIEKKKH